MTEPAPQPPSLIPPELLRRYRERLKLHAAALRAARDDVAAGHEEGEATIRRIAHSLRGSGGTYGFPELSERAGRVEDAAHGEFLEPLEALLELIRLQTPAAQAQPKILVVDDAEEVHVAVGQALSADYEATPAHSAEEARRLLTQGEFALVILDLALPDGDGRDLLQAIKREPNPPPVVVLTASKQKLARVETLALGADDFLQKPFELDLLATHVSRVLARKGEADPRDSLTGLPTRTSFAALFRRASAAAEREGTPLSLAILDFDGFKGINDTLGHLAGDAVLRHFATAAVRVLRGSDLIARWGGDEFVALFPRTARAGGMRALQGLQEDLIARPLEFEGSYLTCLFSRGVVEVTPGQSLEEALGDADRDLYRDKRREKVPQPRRKILLVDDDPDFAAIVSHCFAERGFELHHAPDAAAASAWLAENTPSACLLDVHLPGKSGFELLEELRGGSLPEEVPVLMLTSANASDDVVRGFDLGADDYVFKPCDPLTLVARLRRRFDKTGRWRR